MRPIKFRGQVIKDGRFVYGDLFQFKSKTAICTDIVSFLFEKKHSALVEVTPDSVAQLVGYDADGNEVYEGDELVGRFNQVWVANVYCGAENNDDWTYYTDLKNLKLKKE